MANTEQDVYTLVLDADVLPASRKVAAYQKDLDREFKKVTKSIEKMASTTNKANKKSAQGVGDLVDAYKEESQTVSNLTRILDGLNRRATKASGEELKILQRRIKDTKTLFSAQKQAAKSSIRESARAAKEEQRQAKKGAKKMKGVFDTLFEGTDIGRKSKGLREKGAGMSKRGGRVAKLGGKMGGGKGGALKGIGKAMGGMGKMVGMLSKVIPVIGTVATAIAAVVKLFLDADAHVKEFNKSILDLAGTNEFLGSSAQGTAGDFAKMNKVLNETRKTAEEFWFNNDWGIMPEDHVKVLNVFNQEGVSLRAMSKEADRAYESTRAYQQELMAVSVAYSRAFGVPMQEINTLQAELMSEMGMGLEDTKLAFAQMSRAAADSGIASNKFFAMIRGVSSDLSLYNLRLGSAVKLLGMLGKVMNPREAQKFMQFAMQGLKGMSQDDRMKLNMLTGGKGKGIIKKDIANREKALHVAMGKALGYKGKPEDIAKQVQAEVARTSKKEVFKKIKEAAPEKAGTLKGADIELTIDKTAATKGVYGEAFAMENMGAGGSLEMMQAALAPWGGGKTLLEGAGSLGMGKMAENLGVSTQHLRGLMKVEVAVQEEKEALLEKAKSQEEKDKINAMGAQDVIDSMSEDQQAALKEASMSEMDLMKAQTKATDSIMNQITRLLDFIMNQVYGVLSSILDSVIGLIKKFVWGDEKTPVEQLRDEESRIRGLEEGPMKKALEEVMKKTAGASVETRLAALAKAVPEEEKKDRARKEQERMNEALGFKKMKEEEHKAMEVGGVVGMDVQAAAKEAGVTDPAVIKTMEDLQSKIQAASFMGDTKTMAGFHEELVAARAPFGAKMGLKEPEQKGTGLSGMSFVDPKTGEELSGPMLHSGGLKPAPVDPIALPPGSFPSDFKFDPLAAHGEALKTGQGGGASDEQVNQWVKELMTPGGGEKDPIAEFMEGMDPEAQANMSKATQETADYTKAGAESGDKTFTLLKKDGTAYVRFSSSFLKGEFKKTVGDAMLDSMRLALFEYFMYSKLDPEEVAEALVTNGISGPEFAKALGEAAPTGQGAKALFSLEGSSDDDDDDDDPPADETEEQKKKRLAREKAKREAAARAASPTPAPARQHGGIVRRIDRHGYAEFEPRSGEGLTAIGPGEQIVPAYNRGKGGGGSQHVTVSLRGDAMKLFQAMVTDGIYENKRRERNH